MSQGRWNRNRVRFLAEFAIYLLLLCLFHQRQFNSHTPVSRLNLLHAIVEEQTLKIDRWRANTADLAYYSGHYYSDKAPGTAALGLPGFMTGAAVLRVAGISIESPEGWRVTSWSASAAIACIVAWGLCIMRRLLVGIAGHKEGIITSLALWFGAAPLPYSTILYSHAQVVACIALGLYCLAGIPRWKGLIRGTASAETMGQAWNPQSRRYLLLAGFAFGWALNSEYTAGVVVVSICVLLLGICWRAWLYVLCGMLGPMLLVPLYSWMTIGTPFFLPYSYQASFPEMQHGLFAIGWPDGMTAAQLLFSPRRGLLFWTPFLVIALFGYAELYRRSKHWFWLCYLAPLLNLLIISGRIWDWPAANTYSARYLSPVLPLLAIPCALGVTRAPRLAIGLAVYSILITSIATITDAMPVTGFLNPLLELQLPLLLKGDLSPNLLSAIGFPPWTGGLFFYFTLLAAGAQFWKNQKHSLTPRR